MVNGLGSASTLAVTYGKATLCGIVASQPIQRIQCYQNNRTILVLPNVSFQAISGGQAFFCGLRSGGFSLLCWDTATLSNSSFHPKRIYDSTTVELTDLTVGDAQVCAREVNSGIVRCWRGYKRKGFSLFPSPGEALKFKKITSGSGFTCGVLKKDHRVVCWGQSLVGKEIQSGFENLTMISLVAGKSHACGLTMNGTLVCRGNHDSGQLKVPFSSAFEYSGLALGANFTCAIRLRNGLVQCWGGGNILEIHGHVTENTSFELIVAGLDFACGLVTSNLSIICWGPGWSNSRNDLPLGMILPGPCVQSSCGTCGTYPDSQILCRGSRNICKSCQTEHPLAVPWQPRSPSQSQPSLPVSPPSSKAKNKLLLAFLIVGSVGVFIGLCSIVYCLWTKGVLCSRCNNPINRDSAIRTDNSYTAPPPMTTQVSMSMSSSKRSDKTETFSLSELASGANNFSPKNQIGAGSFGIVYKGKLLDGREVAIKRGETSTKTKKFQEKETAFDSELSLLSRLHHKHLVGLLGFCQEKDERLLVYEYMSNGALYDHLHGKNNTEKTSSILNSWKMRIKIALDAARGIEYLHNYAVPPIIHRDIKSSNILLDSNWTGKVSDFGLSLLGPKSDQESVSTKAVGTVGYIDPEYYALNELTTKSDVYSLGVVVLELLTGKKAVFKNEGKEEGVTGTPMSVVEYAVPKLSAGELQSLLDKRVGPPGGNEVGAVKMMAYTAMDCVNLEGKQRPGMNDIVANLERAFLSLCEEEASSHLFSGHKF